MDRLDRFADSPGPLFRPAARATDPASSHAAERRHTTNGRRGGNAAIVLAAVRRRPGLTSAELAVETGLERHECARRLSDLENEGLIRKDRDDLGHPKLRPCGTNGHKMATWHPK